jgi:hypothetical protein
MRDRQGELEVAGCRSAGLLSERGYHSPYLHTVEEIEDCFETSLIRGWIIFGRYDAGIFLNLRWMKTLQSLSCSPTFQSLGH